MDAESLVLALLSAVPGKEIHGRKRLQKLAFFAVESGTKASVKFFIHEFGPFSAEVASATDILACVGAIAEDEAQFEKTKRYYKRYRLLEADEVEEELAEQSRAALQALSEFSTIELEIASTIRFFIAKGLTADEAIKKTAELKPSKSKPKIIERAKEALTLVGLYERRRTDQVSGSRPN